MTSSPRPGVRILGSLRSADGKGVVRIEDRYDTSVDDLWSALTDPGRLADWYGQVEGDLRPGGQFRLHVEDADADATGFVFYTNMESAKGRELAANAHAALLLHWKSTRKQIRARGPVTQVSDAEADAYFATRPKDSQIGAWASAQSRAMEGRFALEREIAKYAAKYALQKVPRPPYWSGYRIVPLEIEFWRDRPFRLHDRLVYRRDAPDKPWRTQRLFP